MTLDFQHFFSCFYLVRFSLEICLAPKLALLHLICVLLATKPCSSSNFHDHTMCLFETPFSKPSPSLPESIARGLFFLRPTHCSPLHLLPQAVVGFQTRACLAGCQPYCTPWLRFCWQSIRTCCCLKSACTGEEGGAKEDPQYNQPAGLRHSFHSRRHPPTSPRSGCPTALSCFPPLDTSGSTHKDHRENFIL